MKKLVALVLAFMLLTGSAFAETLMRADSAVNAAILSRYENYNVDKDGNFSVTTDRGATLKASFDAKAPTIMLQGALAFRTEVWGNVNTGIAYPVLKLFYMGSTLNVNAVSVAVNGKRYDFNAVGSASVDGRNSTEEIVVFLDSEGVEMLNEVLDQQSAYVLLSGANGRTSMKVEYRTEDHGNARVQLLSDSVQALRYPDGVPAFDGYSFMNEARAIFARKTGLMPRVEVKSLAEPCDLQLDENLSVMIESTPEKGLRDMCKLLIESGYMTGNVEGRITDEFIAAVRRAQSHFGLLVNGAADAELISLLEADAAPTDVSANIPESYAFVGEEAQFTLNRWWVADAVETTVVGGGKTVSDKDNTFVIADGKIQSVGTEALALAWEAGAELVFNGKWSFPAYLYCETNAGEAFSTTLAMLAKTRLVVVSEVPEYLTQADGSWMLRLTLGKETYDFVLL